jgi:hypothetical protein
MQHAFRDTFRSFAFNFFPSNLGAVRDKPGETLHQDISDMETRYQEKWNSSMLVECGWSLNKEASDLSYEPKTLTQDLISSRGLMGCDAVSLPCVTTQKTPTTSLHDPEDLYYNTTWCHNAEDLYYNITWCHNPEDRYNITT